LRSEISACNLNISDLQVQNSEQQSRIPVQILVRQRVDSVTAKGATNSVISKRRRQFLGSNGSIGCNTLRVIEALGERFRVVALGAGHNIDVLAEQSHDTLLTGVRGYRRRRRRIARAT